MVSNTCRLTNICKYAGTLDHIISNLRWRRLYCTALPLMVNSSASSSPPHLLWLTAHRLRMTGDFCPLLEVRMRTITQLSLVGAHPSPVRDVTWPSEGDGVMYEAGWQHKVRMATLSRGVGGWAD